MLDLMSLDGSHKIVIHGGGVYGNRAASAQRLVNEVSRLPQAIRRRLVLENDEHLFNLAEIVGVAKRAGVPVVFDLHHHRINPAEEDLGGLLRRVRALWDCVPKVHLSSQRPNARVGAHDDLLHERDLQDLCEVLPWEADLMLESKAKEVAASAAWNWLHANGKGEPNGLP